MSDEIDEMEPVDQEEHLVRENKKEPEPSLKHKLIIYSIPIVILVLIIIGIILVFTIPKASKNDDNKDLPKKGLIKLIYRIDTNDLNTDPISHEYKKQNDFELYVGGLKFKNYMNFQFPSEGTYNVEIFLYENKIHMDHMFKDVSTLTNIQMISNGEIIYIESMESTFENCVSLTSISISGFNTYKVKSMSKLFKSTSLSSIDLRIFNTSNVIDMSFMFANSYSLTHVNLEKMNTKQVQDMSYFFYSCKSLTSINLNIDGSNLKNMSKMFSDCTNLKDIEVNKFKADSIIDMSYMFENCEKIKELKFVS